MVELRYAFFSVFYALLVVCLSIIFLIHNVWANHVFEGKKLLTRQHFHKFVPFCHVLWLFPFRFHFLWLFPDTSIYFLKLLLCFYFGTVQFNLTCLLLQTSVDREIPASPATQPPPVAPAPV